MVLAHVGKACNWLGNLADALWECIHKIISIRYVLQPLFESLHNGCLLPRRKKLVSFGILVFKFKPKASKRVKNILKQCSCQGFMNLAKSLMVPSLFAISYFTSLYPGTMQCPENRCPENSLWTCIRISKPLKGCHSESSKICENTGSLPVWFVCFTLFPWLSWPETQRIHQEYLESVKAKLGEPLDESSSEVA